MRNTITAEEFLRLVRGGDCQFKDTDIVGDLDLGKLEIEWLYLDHVRFLGDVIGSIAVSEISIHSDMSVYVSYQGADYVALCYTGGLLKELSG